MAQPKSPRKGSLQFWPRKRVSKFLPSVNWKSINSGKNIKGFIGYKAGMFSVEVKDTTPNSMTKDKRIIIPSTVIECPPMKIFSIRFYKNGKVAKDVLAEHVDKELKRKVKLPKQGKNPIDSLKSEGYDDVSIIVYSQVKKTGVKKTPDLTELGLTGTIEDKLNFIKSHLNKDISINEVFSQGELVDVRGLSKGKGFQGPVKRFGIKLRFHKSEKGVRKVGSIGPWHPARVTYRVPMAGQLGMFTRVHYNQKILQLVKSEDVDNQLKNIKNYGDTKTDYIILYGSVQGPAKRQILLTAPLRPSKMQKKKIFEFVEVKK
ncbi:MAG TPA: 50S ribosomal protein L3 [Candidatus Pacearchaeota archaeon]|jgi:large subunit ribosomal protein L3|nr:50S ribosomal protein L3 [Candidatus Pacearchaeota archaeon]HNZ52251.1 50S ribosomal protein L3 [Candidatus Pacearchaeota archaeon]HOC96901.1 50S ribosomal protein L3 [Candidatus Pacearchaeota archaeon]HOF44214.1 50S ribosomal protein L3 [Candidatus Pacearchaeota archaeon]HOH04311.1 50S ribosomal protein L3 [Candidatus Pacearchaeota archaeon]